MQKLNLKVYLVIVLAAVLITSGILYGIYLFGGDDEPTKPPIVAQVVDMKAWSEDAVNAFLASEDMDTEGVNIREEHPLFFDTFTEVFQPGKCQENAMQLAVLIDKQAASFDDPYLARFQIVSIMKFRIVPGSESDCETWLMNGEYEKDMQ